MSTDKIGFLGPEGTFTDQALREQHDLSHLSRVEFPRFADILNAVSDGSVSYGFVAIENAIEGTVNMTLDALCFDHDLQIQREVDYPIQLDLMARGGTEIGDILSVHSHPVAIGQCRKYLTTTVPHASTVPTNSTLAAAELAKSSDGVAAIAPALAAEIYGLQVLDQDVADQDRNTTRFVVVGRDQIPAQTGNDKTSVILTQYEDRSGSLISILQEFAARDINLSRLTSRPLKDRELGKYCFIVDFAGHISEAVVADCLVSVKALHADVKVLGSYPSGSKAAAANRSKSDARETAVAWLQSIQAMISES